VTIHDQEPPKGEIIRYNGMTEMYGCTTGFAVSAFGIAPSNGQAKSPARQECEADATSVLSQSKEVARQSLAGNVVLGAAIGIVAIPGVNCVLAAAVAEAEGPEATLPACVAAFLGSITPPAIAIDASIGAVGGVVFTGAGLGTAYSEYYGKMSLCAKIPWGEVMSKQKRKLSRLELRMATAVKITGRGKRKYFRCVWIGMTVFWWLVGNLLLRRELISAYEAQAGSYVFVCWAVLSLLVSAFLGYLSTRAAWLHLTRVDSETTRQQSPK
jgi:hypothetical protein